jgi:succinate dehydrogenase / fumarate reductase, cytochrome b subunit
MTMGNRPLSPHLQVYKMPMSGIMSITHRITGVIMSLGLVFFTYWIVAAAYGPEAFDRAQSVMNSWFGMIIVFGWTACLFYHLVNGIRHLRWDTVRGLEKENLVASGRVVIALAVILTVAFWIFAAL